MDGFDTQEGIILVAATNRPDVLDPALLRPGRFDRIVLTPSPDKESRKAIFKIHTKDMPLKNVSIEKLAEKTEGYVGADIEAICREAAIDALRKDISSKEVTMKNFENALAKVRPSVTKEIEDMYDSLKDKFKAATAKQMKKESPSLSTKP
jgi:transitional endoplasmic reticulum ATPase